jgi:hypothetical protein
VRRFSAAFFCFVFLSISSGRAKTEKETKKESGGQAPHSKAGLRESRGFAKVARMTGEENQRATRWIDRAWLLVVGLASSAWCLSAAAELGATFDEPIYMARGLDGWRRGTHGPLLSVGTMPLPTDVATLPLYLYERWTGTQFDFRAGAHSRPLFWARSTTLVFWWLLLIFAMRIGRDLAGPWGGRLAVTFLACDPNLLAHAALATTDIAAAALFLAVAWSFARGRTEPAWRRVVVPGIWFGLALLAKASALVFVPLAWALIEWQRKRSATARSVIRKNSDSRGTLANSATTPASGEDSAGPAPAAFRRDVTHIGLIGVLLLFVLCGCDWEAEPSFVKWADALPESQTKELWRGVAGNLKVFPNAGVGLVKQIRHNVRGHSTYLLGTADARGLWYYYPVLYTIKIPEPWLLLPGLLLVTRPRALANWACLVAAGLAVYCLTCRVQIGIRLMLPWLALGLTGLAAAVVVSVRSGIRKNSAAAGVRSSELLRIPLLVGVSAGVVWLAWSALALWPDNLRYVNRFWGGPEHGHLLVSDSNFDWGQGLPELARWQREHGVEELDVCHVGTDPLLAELPMRPVPLHQMNVPEMLDHVRGRWLAVSATWLYGAYVRDSEVVTYLRGLEPAARTSTFFLFDFTQ